MAIKFNFCFRWPKKPRPSFLFLALVATVACGTLSVDLETKVESEAAFEHRVEMRATGMFAEMILENPDSGVGGLGGDLDFDIERDGESVIMTGEGKFSGEEARRGLAENPSFQIETTDTGSHIEYRVSFNLKDLAEDSEDVGLDEDIFEEFGKELIESMAHMFTLDWTVEVPGTIVETNARSHEENTATWHANLSDLAEAREFFVVSRVKKSGDCS